jgi:hypothetical protein
MDEGPALVHASFLLEDYELMQNLGFGLGLRPDHYEAILTERPRV